MYFFIMLYLRVIYFFFFLMIRRPPRSTRTDTLFPYTTLFRSQTDIDRIAMRGGRASSEQRDAGPAKAVRRRTHLSRRRSQRRQATICTARALGRAPTACLFLRWRRDMTRLAPTTSSTEERRVGTECVHPCRPRWTH